MGFQESAALAVKKMAGLSLFYVQRKIFLNPWHTTTTTQISYNHHGTIKRKKIKTSVRELDIANK